MSADEAKIALANLSNLDRLELEAFLKSWNGGAAWTAEPGEFKEQKSGTHELGQPDYWILLFVVGSPLVQAIASWIAQKRRTVKVTLERTGRNGEKLKQTIELKESSPENSAEATKAIAEKLSDAIKQMSD